MFNIATGDYVTVREIASIALEVLGLDGSETEVRYGEQPRGWKGDVRLCGQGHQPDPGARLAPECGISGRHPGFDRDDA